MVHTERVVVVSGAENWAFAFEAAHMHLVNQEGLKDTADLEHKLFQQFKEINSFDPNHVYRVTY